MTAVTESVKSGQKKQKERRTEDQEKVVNDPKKAEVLVQEISGKEQERAELEAINGKLIAWATGLKDIAMGLAEIDKDNEFRTAGSVLLTICLDLVDSVEKRSAEWQNDELEERRRKDRELTEQDKEIMALVKELQDPNLS